MVIQGYFLKFVVMKYFIGNDSYEGVEKATIEDCYEYLKDKMEIGIDIETTPKYPKNTYKNEDVYKPGLDPYLSKIVMLQIGDLDNIFIIDTRVVDIAILKPLFEDKERVFIGHNLKFEAKHLKYNYGIRFRKIWDTMLCEINLTNGLGWSKSNHDGLRYSLAALAGRYLGVENAEELDLFNQRDDEIVYVDKSTRLGFSNIGDKPFTLEQVLYGSDDVEFPLKIREKQLKGRFGYNPMFLHEKVENPFCLVLADIELKGMAFKPEQWLEVYEKKKIIYQHRLDKMNNHIINNYPKFVNPVDLFNSAASCSIQWSSSDQVIEFFKHLGICPKEKSKQTKTIEYTVGAKSLTKLLNSEYKELYMSDKETDIEDISDLILNYLLLKKSEQAVTTFGEDWLKYIHPITGRVHTSFSQIMNTGRVSSNNPNVQNIPGEEEYRKAFIGNLINCDFASQESRVLAEVCGDKDMLSFFNDGHPIFGDDYHCFTATKMFRIIRNDPELIVLKKTHPKERQDAKSIGFKIAYGGSAYTLKDDFGVEEDVAQEFIDGYFEAFPSLKADFDKAKEDVVKKGYIEIDKITGRRWFDPNFQKMNELGKKAWSYFPDDYRRMKVEDRKVFKKKLYEEHPEIKEIWSEYFSLKGKLERNALNFRIQGLAASQTKMAGIMFREKQIEEDLEDKIGLTSLIHDECIAETSPDFREEGRKIVEECMENGAQFFCEKVKMKAGAVIVDFWYH